MIYRIFAKIEVAAQIRWFDVETGNELDAQRLVTAQVQKDFGNNVSINVNDITAVRHIGTYYKGILAMEDKGEGVFAPTDKDSG